MNTTTLAQYKINSEDGDFLVIVSDGDLTHVNLNGREISGSRISLVASSYDVQLSVENEYETTSSVVYDVYDHLAKEDKTNEVSGNDRQL